MFKHKKLAKQAVLDGQANAGAKAGCCNGQQGRKSVNSTAANGKRSTLKKETKKQQRVNNEHISQHSSEISDLGVCEENGKEDEDWGRNEAQDVFKDLISQVNKINEIIDEPHQAKGGELNTPLKTKIVNGAGKENSVTKSLGQSLSHTNTPHKAGGKQKAEGQENAMLNVLLSMMSEIKSQNLHIIERQAELEYLIEREIMPSISEGFTTIKKEVKRLAGAKGPREDQRGNRTLKRRTAIMTTQQQVRFSSAVQERYGLSEKPPQIQVTSAVIDGIPMESTNIRMEEGFSDGTFMRKLDQTTGTPMDEQEDSMRLSIGANLMQIMQFNQPQPIGNSKAKGPKRVMRNFNFRCNLQEIDRIIEEDSCSGIFEAPLVSQSEMPAIIEEEKDSQMTDQVQDASAIVATQQILCEINQSILQDQQQEEQTMVTVNCDSQNQQQQLQGEVSPDFNKRPSTGRKQPRKAWGVVVNPTRIPPLRMQTDDDSQTVNVDDSVKSEVPEQIDDIMQGLQLKRPTTGKVNHQPQFGLGQGIRIKRIHVAKEESEDPILALLRMESSDKEETKVVESVPSQVEASLPLDKIEPINDQDSSTTPRKGRAIQIKRQIGGGMFKAPPPNLIESLLQQEEEVTTSNLLGCQNRNSPKSSAITERDTRNAVFNNYMKDRSPSANGRTDCQRSPILLKRKVSPLPVKRNAIKAPQYFGNGLNLDQSDDEFSSAQKDKGGENPFDSSCIKSTGVEDEVSEPKRLSQGDQMRNLFFHQKSDQVGRKGDTADFGL